MIKDVTDMHGTLLDEQESVTFHTWKALDHSNQKGICFVIATGNETIVRQLFGSLVGAGSDS